MKIDLNEILYAISSGFDAVEQELLNIRPGHCKRIAAMSIMLGKSLGLSSDELIDLAAFSILHDNALTEVNQEELEYKKYNEGESYSIHDYNARRCIIGERNTKFMPFRTNNRDVLLLHHENADGSGPQGRTYDRTPIKAQIIHLANSVDTHCDLSTITKENYTEICNYVRNNSGRLFSVEVSAAFLKAFKPKMLTYLAPTNIDAFLRGSIKKHNDEYSYTDVDNLATLLAHIVDFKSHYNCRHSIGVAQKAKIMAEYYEFPADKVSKYYLAGALHDIGKLMISIDILDKPDRLSEAEFEKMKSHAYYTSSILNNIKGMKDIMVWASHHHEKLNGTGYPFHLTGDVLSHEERLMTCCDIYQALAEERIYKEAYPHDKIIHIMKIAVEKGEIVRGIAQADDELIKL